MPSRPDNPEGFYENLKFVDLNDEILESLGSAWDSPPDIVKVLEPDAKIEGFRKRAEELCGSFSGQDYWGWKDPRNCLTLWFWKPLFKNMKVVICIRNPYEVIESLKRRNGISGILGLKLWYNYNQKVFAITKPDERIISHYNNFFISPEAELERLIKFIGLDVKKEIIEQACKAVSLPLRRHFFTIEDIQDMGMPLEIVRLYQDMCAEAGVFDDHPGREEETEYQAERVISELKQDIYKQNITLQCEANKVQVLEQTVTDLEGIIRKDKEIIAEKDLQIKQAERVINELKQDIYKQNITLRHYQNEITRLKTIEESLIWRGISKVLRFVDNVLLPWHTKRGRYYLSLLRKLRSNANGYAGSVTSAIERPGLIFQSVDFECLEFKEVQEPLVSVIIPAYNHAIYTYNCLRSILENVGEGMPYEVIVANDSSTDNTLEMLSKIKGVKVITGERNLGFVRNCNNAAKHARGKYLLFLNNDTNVQEYWMESLVSTFDRDEKIGMVGSKLIFNKDCLQEAGGIIWQDATAWNYGRGDDPEKPEYNYLKEADYISGASIMIRRDLWEEIGGFDTRFEPAYFDDADLAFEVRRRGYKVVYQPRSVVIHFEGITHGRDLNMGIKSYQVKNRDKFISKWRDVLEREHFKNGQNVFVARDRSRNKKAILVIDHYVPAYDKDAGNRTSFQYLKLLSEMGYNVKFIGDNFYRHEPYTTELQQMGIEVFYGEWYRDNWSKWIKDNAGFIDYAYLQRPHIAIKYIDYLRKNTRARIIYYVHDLHYLSLLKKYELTGDKDYLKNSEDLKKIEFEIFDKSDVITTPSISEREILLNEFPEKEIHVQPCYFYDSFREPINNFDERRDIMFVGGFGHPPNVDAAVWFSREALPEIIKSIPEIKLFIVGSNPTKEILNLSSPNIVVTGYISDEELTELYNRIKVVVIPLRYGAGTKGKTVEALYHGVPVVSTSFGIEGLEDIERLIKRCDTVKDFVDEVIRLYRLDGDELMKISHKYIEYTKQYFSKDRALKLLNTILPQQ
ncbi:MAG: glycosyltransferase [Thermodesulfovibrionales bacterium]